LVRVLPGNHLYDPLHLVANVCGHEIHDGVRATVLRSQRRLEDSLTERAGKLVRCEVMTTDEWEEYVRTAFDAGNEEGGAAWSPLR
jgi:hypothetical protein